MAWGFTDVAHTGEEIVSLFAAIPEFGHAFQEAAGQVGEEFGSMTWCRPASSIACHSVRQRPTDRALLSRPDSFSNCVNGFKDSDWSTAPELVSDARFYLGPDISRSGNIGVSEAWSEVGDAAWNPELQRDVLARCAAA